MKQKIVIKVEMKSEKSKSKAMKIAAGKNGVSSVKIGGEEKDRVIVIGDEVNMIDLILSLKKKVGSARIISVRVLSEEGNYEYDYEDENKLHFTTTSIQSPRIKRDYHFGTEGVNNKKRSYPYNVKALSNIL